MTLGDVLQLLLRAQLLQNNPPLPLAQSVTLVTDNSKEVCAGAVFICKGAQFQVAYLQEAIANGASCYVSETAYPEAMAPHLQVRDVRAAMSRLAVAFYRNPAKELSVVGITGTKGKTTVSFFLRSILEQYEVKTAFLSSLLTYDGAQEWESKLTTPEPLEAQKILRSAVEHGCRYAVMEVSSQALKYGRVAHLEFAVGVYLNIGEDHIGPREHPDWEDYFSSKLKLFEQCAIACVNLDGAMSERALLAAQSASRVLTFSAQHKHADIFAYNIKKTELAMQFSVKTPRFDLEIHLPMAGVFNISNALAALAAAEALGLPKEAMERGLACARVPGRMEHYGSGDLIALVDYAHNPMSLKALLESARVEYPNREVTVVFGCTGGKGLSRRAPMGEIAGALADRVFLTEDDPAQEDVVEISAEIAAASDVPMEIVPDRAEAILQAVLGATRPAVILVAGKGTETIQKRKDGYAPYIGDPEAVKQALARALKAEKVEKITP